MLTSSINDIKRIIHENNNYICQKCGKKIEKKNVVLHHLKYPAKSIKDLETYCRKCHQSTINSFNKRGKRKFTEVQFLKLYNEGYNDSIIAKKLEVSQPTISLTRKRLNLKPIQLKQLKCLRCDHEWVPRKEEVRICPKCKSPYWDRERESDNNTYRCRACDHEFSSDENPLYCPACECEDLLLIEEEDD